VAKILIVEDDEMLMDLMQQTLELSDHAVRGAVNGLDALAKVKADSPELILMDIGMPLMDGYEATRRLKADPATKHIPVIALTAHASANDRKQAMEAGADEYEPKPVEFERLEGKIKALLERGQS
jgi:two-component system, cell cycle response regulator DivK